MEARHAIYGSEENATYQQEEIAAATCDIIQHMNAQTEARVSTIEKLMQQLTRQNEN